MYLNLYRSPGVNTVQPVLGGFVDSLFSDFLGSSSEARAQGSVSHLARIDVLEKDGSYEAYVEIPGVAKEDIDVSIDGTRVSVKAQAKEQAVEKDGARALHTERRTRYARSFDLPQEVDLERATASYENGVLTLLLPKKDVVQPKRLRVG